MGIFDKVLSLFGGLSSAIDNIHTSDEERLAAKSALLGIQFQILQTMVGYQEKLAAAQQSIITAEIQSDSWLTKSWRPLAMLGLILFVLGSLVLNQPVPDQLWFLTELGLGGYVVSRSVEKVTSSVVNGNKKDAH